MSYLSGYIFYSNKHVIKHLNRNRTDECVIDGQEPGSLWFFYLFNFELYLVLQFFNECELIR